MTWSQAFVWTLLLEFPVYVACLRRELGVVRSCALVLLVNAVTHPLIWIAPRFEPFWAWLLIAESAVVMVEASLVRLAMRRRLGLALAAAFAANLFSTLVGLV